MYYLWIFRLLPDGLKTTAGETVEIISPGTRNHDSGPDFFNARIKIGGTLWAGNVEAHLRTSDWQRHGHTGNKAYASVILHVVAEHDNMVGDSPQNVLELKNFIDPELEQRYEKLLASRGAVPCEPETKRAGTTAIETMLSRTLVERLETRYGETERLLAETGMSWEEAFYMRMARSYGLRVNADAMEMLARSLPLRILARHRDNLFQVEALLFGQAGLLNQGFSDAWPRQLQNEYSFLQKKYTLKPLDGSIWKFARMRPPSFPTVRIAQFAALIHHSEGLFSRLTGIASAGEASALLKFPASDYWKNHYRFDLQSPAHSPAPGENLLQLVLINTAAPFLFAWGRDRGSQEAAEKALNLLAETSPEANSQIAYWKKQGIGVPSAFHSQALLELRKMYCDRRRCLDCQIGHKLIKNR